MPDAAQFFHWDIAVLVTDVFVEQRDFVFTGSKKTAEICKTFIDKAREIWTRASKAGYTHARQTATFHGPIADFPPETVHRKFDGWRLGGGAEVAVGRNLFVKAEYRFSNYDSHQSFDKHQGVIGLGLRF